MAKSTKGDSFAEKIPVVDGLNRSLLGFNDSLQSLIGTEVPARIDSSASSLSSINSSLEQVLSSDPAQSRAARNPRCPNTEALFNARECI